MPVQSCNDSDNLDAEEIFHISHFETLPVRVMLLRAKPAVTESCHVFMSKLRTVGKKGTMMNCVSYFIIAKGKSHYIKVVYLGEFV